MQRLIRSMVWVQLVVLLFMIPSFHTRGFSSSYHELLRLGRGSIGNMAWSPDGGTLAVTGGDTIWLYTYILEDVAVLKGHTDFITSIQWSHNNDRIASASQDGTARIWDISTSNSISLQLSEDRIDFVLAIWSPDDTQIATTNPLNNTILLWDTTTGEELAVLQGHGEVINAISWSPDGTVIVSSGFDHAMRFWSTETYQEITSFDTQSDVAHSIEWTPDGSQLLIYYYRSISIWDIRTNQVTASLNVSLQNGLVNWSSNSEEIIGLDLNRGRMWVWDLVSDQWNTVLTSEALKGNASWNLDRNRLAVAKDNILSALDLETANTMHTLNTHQGEVSRIAWSSDGEQIASGDENGQIRLWNATGGQLQGLLLGPLGQIVSLEWKPDGTQLAGFGLSGDMYIWDTTTLEIIFILGGVSEFAWSPDGTQFVVRRTEVGVLIWDSMTWEFLDIIGNHHVYTLAWSPDGTRLALGAEQVSVYDVNTKNLLVEMQGNDNRSDLTWSPDGAQILSSGLSYSEGPVSAVLWDAFSGELLSYLPLQDSVSWQPGGQLLAGTQIKDGISKIVVLDINTLDILEIVDSGDTNTLQVVWSPDGTRLASSHDDYSIRIWEQ